MALEQTLTDTLTQAIKAKDGRTADVVRMLKTKIQERRTAKGFAGTVDDALVLDVIGAYRKLLQKALAEYEKVGERGAAQATELRFEIEFCERYLPRGLDEEGVAHARGVRSSSATRLTSAASTWPLCVFMMSPTSRPTCLASVTLSAASRSRTSARSASSSIPRGR